MAEKDKTPAPPPTNKEPAKPEVTRPQPPENRMIKGTFIEIEKKS